LLCAENVFFEQDKATDEKEQRHSERDENVIKVECCQLIDAKGKDMMMYHQYNCESP
jgi:hypothetical protein